MIPSSTLYEWIEDLGELDRLLASIRNQDKRDHARELIDKLEREIHQRYLDANAVETRCACTADTPDAATIPAPLSQVRSA